MRIGIDIKAFKNGTTGISRYLRSLLDELQTQDNQNEFILFECSRSGYLLKNPRWKTITLQWKLPGILWQQLILPFQLMHHRIDVLWSPEQICPVLLPGRIAVVTTVYDLTALRFPKTCQTSNLIIQRILFPMTIDRSTTLLPISDFVGREVLHFYGTKKNIDRKLKTISCASPAWTLPSTYTVADRQDFLFFAGNMEPRKNLLNLLRALVILRSAGIIIPLKIAGPQGWKNSELSEFLANSDITDQVSFLGYLDEKGLQEMYLTCKALVYPSVYEGFGLPVLEALLLDCVVITSRNTVMEEIAGTCAVYFDPEKPEAIADVIQSVYADPFDRTSVLSGSTGVLRQYSWEQSAIKLQELLIHEHRFK